MNPGSFLIVVVNLSNSRASLVVRDILRQRGRLTKVLEWWPRKEIRNWKNMEGDIMLMGWVGCIDWLYLGCIYSFYILRLILFSALSLLPYDIRQLSPHCLIEYFDCDRHVQIRDELQLFPNSGILPWLNALNWTVLIQFEYVKDVRFYSMYVLYTSSSDIYITPSWFQIDIAISVVTPSATKKCASQF